MHKSFAGLTPFALTSQLGFAVNYNKARRLKDGTAYSSNCIAASFCFAVDTVFPCDIAPSTSDLHPYSSALL